MNLNKGKLIAVDNIEKKQSSKYRTRECSLYYSIHLEDVTGKLENTVLLTQDESTKLKTVVLPDFMTDGMVRGRLYPFRVGVGKYSYIVKVVFEADGEQVVQISERLYNKGIERAKKHPASTLKKSLIEDLLD